jgi:hypothetical protein
MNLYFKPSECELFSHVIAEIQNLRIFAQNSDMMIGPAVSNTIDYGPLEMMIWTIKGLMAILFSESYFDDDRGAVVFTG